MERILYRKKLDGIIIGASVWRLLNIKNLAVLEMPATQHLVFLSSSHNYEHPSFLQCQTMVSSCGWCCTVNEVSELL